MTTIKINGDPYDVDVCLLDDTRVRISATNTIDKSIYTANVTIAELNSAHMRAKTAETIVKTILRCLDNVEPYHHIATYNDALQIGLYRGTNAYMLYFELVKQSDADRLVLIYKDMLAISNQMYSDVTFRTTTTAAIAHLKARLDSIAADTRSDGSLTMAGAVTSAFIIFMLAVLCIKVYL